jgi:hypothetical protein
MTMAAAAAGPFNASPARVFRAVSFSFWLWWIAAVVAGVGACFVMDVLPGRNDSPALVYVIWLVLGMFAGLIHFGTAMSTIKGKDGPTDWASREEGLKFGRRILGITAAYLTLIAALSYPLFWSGGSSGEWLFLVVPDHMGASLTFFFAMMAGAAFVHHVYLPALPKTETK